MPDVKEIKVCNFCANTFAGIYGDNPPICPKCKKQHQVYIAQQEADRESIISHKNMLKMSDEEIEQRIREFEDIIYAIDRAEQESYKDDDD